MVVLACIVGYIIEGRLYCTHCAADHAVPPRYKIPVSLEQAARACTEYASDECTDCAECLCGLAESADRVNWMVELYA